MSARPLSELLETQEPAWPQVKEWLTKAKNPVEVLETTGRRGAEVLLALQVTTRSAMGAIAFETGGLIVDHGWLRLLGSGGLRMEGDLARWNGLTPRPLIEAFDGAMIVAHDVLGGFFALDAGALGPGKAGTFYLAPDTLEWEDVGFGYSGLVQWALGGDLAKFYADFRWAGWEADLKSLSPDRGFNFAPPLFTEAESTTARTRTEIAMPELLKLNLSFADQ